jgi:hypothetical protein
MRPNPLFRVATSLALPVLLALHAPAAHADWGIKLQLPNGVKAPAGVPMLGEDPGKRRQRFEEARRAVNKADSLFPRSYGDDPQAEKDALDKADAQIAVAKKLLTPDLAPVGDEYKQTAAELNTLETRVKWDRLIVACSAARKVVTDVHRTGKPAGDKLLKDLEAAAHKLDATLPADQKKVSQFWTDEAARLRKIDPEVKPVAGQSQANRTPSEKAKYEKAMRDAAKPANTAVNEIERLAKSGDDPIPQGRLDELHAAAEKVKAVDAKAYRYYAHQETTFALENAWRGDEKATAKVIADKLSGDVTTSGVTDGKKLSVQWTAKKGWCYTAMVRFKTSTGQEKIEHLEIDGKGGNTPLQFYGIWGKQLKWERQDGVCATKDTPVTLSGDLVFAGTRNGIRYVVVGHPKEKFPLYLATYMNAHWGDSCDTDAWYSLWTDPIPGSIVYGPKGEPFLMTSPDRAGQSWNTLASATMQNSVRIQKKDLVQTPPKTVTFASQYRFPGCPRQEPKHPDSVKLAKCHDGIDHKYQKPWDAAVAEKEGARTPGAYKAAQAKLDHLKDLDAADRAKQCDPIEAGISKKWEAMFNRIVDFYADHAYVSPIDRAGELFAQDEAWLGNN